MCIPATAARGPVYVSTVISYLLAYDAAYIMDYDNLATELSAQIQVSIALLGTVRKLSVEPIVLLHLRMLRRLFKSQLRDEL